VAAWRQWRRHNAAQHLCARARICSRRALLRMARAGGGVGIGVNGGLAAYRQQ